MKSSIASMARAGVTVAILALVGCTTEDSTSRQDVASITQSKASSAVSTSAHYCGGAASPHVLFLEDADGNALRLMHSPVHGWKYLDHGSTRDASDLVSKVEFSPLTPAHAEPAAPNPDPLAVFVDGPTGYTFAWTGDAGWKFVGHIGDEHSAH